MSYQLTEKIYYSKQGDFSFIHRFMDEYLKKALKNKQDDYNGVVVILKDKAGAKICDLNGSCHHYHSHINIVHFLKGGRDFYTPEEATLDSPVCPDENYELMNHGVEVRFVSRVKSFEVTMMAVSTELNDFQKNCLNQIIDITREIREEGIYPKVNIGIFYGTKDDYGPLTDERIETIKNIIETGRRR